MTIPAVLIRLGWSLVPLPITLRLRSCACRRQAAVGLARIRIGRNIVIGCGNLRRGSNNRPIYAYVLLRGYIVRGQYESSNDSSHA